MLAGEAVLYCCGLAWLSLYVGAGRALPLGLYPFIPGDLAKLLLGALLLPTAWALVGARRGDDGEA